MRSSIIIAVRDGASPGSRRASRVPSADPLAVADNRRMLLAVDVGNTQTHLGAFAATSWPSTGAFATVSGATGDEIAERIAGLLALQRDRARPRSTRSCVSSVVPPLGQPIRGDGGALLRRPLPAGRPRGEDRDADPDRQPVRGRRRPARQRGRRLRALQDACVVVDFGTGINFDAVSAEGEYLGGAIAPGVEISLTALTERGARIAADRARRARDRDRQVDARGDPVRRDLRLRRADRRGRPPDRGELGGEPTFIATGGLAHAIVPFCETIDEVDDLLTLTGLRLIWERNRERLTRDGRRSPSPFRDRRRSSSPTASCSRRSPGSATGSCACRRSATAPGSRSRRWSRASRSRTATGARSRSCCGCTPTRARSRSSSSAPIPT